MKPCIDEEGVNISKTLIGMITLVIVLLTTLSTAVAYTVGVKTSVDSLSNDVIDIKKNIEKIHPRITQNEKDIAVIKAHYENIDLNIQEIKRRLEP